MFQSDLLSKDANWFSRTGRLTIQNVSIETPPLTPNKPVTSDDLVTAEGIETEGELSTLTDLGVPWGQGYYIARPGALEAHRVAQAQSD